MQYFIHRNNEQLGPFTEAEVKAKLAAGAISPSDHVWWQGQQGWVPLSQTALGVIVGASSIPPPGTPLVPGTAAAAAYAGGIKPTSNLAVWALVCGCLSLICSLFASIPAIVLGHLSLSEIKKNPALQGKGMALAGMILGYVFTGLIIISLVFFYAMIASAKSQFTTIFQTLNAQIQSAQAAEMTNNGTSTSPDTSTNDQSATTNSAPATATPATATPDTATPDTSSTTNAPATNQ